MKLRTNPEIKQNIIGQRCIKLWIGVVLGVFHFC